MVVQLENVSLRKEGKQLLTNINWEIKKGEHWVLLGLNGSGKTLLLNIISGYLWPTTGKVRVLHKTFGEYPLGELRKSIGWVSSSFQAKLYEHEYAENIVLSGKFASIGLWEDPAREDIDKALRIMEEIGCQHLINRPYETLSQGERQRILIARALMADIKLLILDEPTNGLDFIAREQLLQTIERIGSAANAPTLIYVTHHVDEILPIYSHMLLLKKGEVFAQGKKEEMLAEDVLQQFFQYPVQLTTTNNRYQLSISQ